MSQHDGLRIGAGPGGDTSTTNATPARPSPSPTLTRCGRALFYLARLMNKVDRDTAKLLKRHVVACMLKYEHAGLPSPPDDALLSCLDAYHSGREDEGELLVKLEVLVHQALSSASELDIGTPMIGAAVGASTGLGAGTAQGRTPTQPLRASPPSPSHRRVTLALDGSHARVTGNLARLSSSLPNDLLSPGQAAVPVTLVYFAPEMRTVAQELAVGNAAGAVVLREVQWNSFPDGWPNLKIDHVKDVRFNAVLLLCSFHSPSVLFQQLSIIYALPTYGAKRCRVVIPWFPTATMERVSVHGEVATASTLARMLSCTPLAANGPVQFSILDIHALQEQFYFGDAVHIRLKSCIGLLQDRLLSLPDAGNVCIVFPDDGACKRFGGKLGAFGLPIICSKRRGPDGSRSIVIQDGDPRGRHAVIVDDLVQSGGTLLECAAVMHAAGAADVSAYVTHAVFPGESWRKFVAAPPPAPVGGDSGVSAIAMAGSARAAAFRHFFITNTIPTVADRLTGVPPFEVLSITPVIEDILGV